MRASVVILSDGDWPYAVYLSVLLVVVAGSYLVSRSGRKLQDLKALMVWGGIVAALVLVFAFKEESNTLWQRFAANLVPGYMVSETGELSIVRATDGMFHVPGKVNGADVEFIFDTGATSIALTAEDAERAGFKLKESDFQVEVSTANGVSRAAGVTLESLEIGGIVERRVKATVAKPAALDQSLLGHSFLDRLQSYEVRGDRLFLRYAAD